MNLTKFEHCWQTNKNYPAPQSNQILIHKPSRIRRVIPEEVVMQPSFTVAILVLQAEGLVSAIRYLGFLFQTTLDGVVAEPNQIAILIGHLVRYTDLVAVEVVGLLATFLKISALTSWSCRS